jgi:predicted nucleic acid-binding protein
MAGVFFPSPEGMLAVDLKRELFEQLSAEIGRQIKKSGATEEKIVSADFESWRKTRRLPVTTVPTASYLPSMLEARQRIGSRDRDDVDLLALVIQLKIPVWSNDNDFENTGVVWYTTASLLATLESKSR